MRSILLAASFSVVLCAGDWENEVRKLRPADTKVLETAVLDDLQRRAHNALTAIQHARTPSQAAEFRPALRQKLTKSLGYGLLPWPPDLHARTVGTLARSGY